MLLVGACGDAVASILRVRRRGRLPRGSGGGRVVRRSSRPDGTWSCRADASSRSISSRASRGRSAGEPIRRDPRMGFRNRRPRRQQPSERGHDDRHDGSDADTGVPNPRRRRRGCRARGGWPHGCGAVVRVRSHPGRRRHPDRRRDRRGAGGHDVLQHHLQRAVLHAPRGRRSGVSAGGTPGGDVALPAGEVGNRQGLAVHRVLLSAPHVPQRPRDPEHAGLAGGRVHRRLPGRRP